MSAGVLTSMFARPILLLSVLSVCTCSNDCVTKVFQLTSLILFYSRSSLTGSDMLYLPGVALYWWDARNNQCCFPYTASRYGFCNNLLSVEQNNSSGWLQFFLHKFNIQTINCILPDESGISTYLLPQYKCHKGRLALTNLYDTLQVRSV